MEVNAIDIEDLWTADCCGLTAKVGIGETHILTGCRGGGPHQLLRVILGMAEPERGTVRVFGDSVHEMASEDLLAMRTFFGVVPATGMLISNLSVFDNVALPLRYHDVHAEPEVVDIVTRELKAHALLQFAHLRPAELNSAQTRLVGLVRAVVINPRVLLLDDLFEGLEEGGYDHVAEVIQQRVEDGCAVMLTTRRTKLATEFDGALLRLPNVEMQAWPRASSDGPR